jgi:hypothetical protein
VNQKIRSNIGGGIKFAIDILEINLAFHNGLTVKDSEQYQFWKLMGMETNSVESICKYWINELKKLL